MKNSVKDLLNRPVQVGDTVLTKGYYEQELTEVAPVIQVSETWAKVELPAYSWDYSVTPSVWIKTGTKIMKRESYQMVVVDEQLAANKHTGINYDEA